MAEGHRADPSAVVGMTRPPATKAAGGLGVVRTGDSFIRRLGEAVAHAEHSLDVVLSDLLPDVLDVGVDSALIRLERHASYRIEQLRAGEYPAWLPCHHGHDLEFTLGQVHALAPESGFHPRHVQLHVVSDADYI